MNAYSILRIHNESTNTKSERIITMIKSITCGRFEIRKPDNEMEYWLDGVQVQYSDYTFDEPERITFEVLTEILDRENEDNNLKWE